LACEGVSRSTVPLLILVALPLRVSKGMEKSVTVNPSASGPLSIAKANVNAEIILIMVFMVFLWFRIVWLPVLKLVI
jgi:hypothetical protein